MSRHPPRRVCFRGAVRIAVRIDGGRKSFWLTILTATSARASCILYCCAGGAALHISRDGEGDRFPRDSNGVYSRNRMMQTTRLLTLEFSSVPYIRTSQKRIFKRANAKRYVYRAVNTWCPKGRLILMTQLTMVVQ